jgi:photosystem II stability/assembly factor-like uncharacterized protein
MIKKFALITLILIILAIYPAHAQDRAWKVVRQGGMSIHFNDVFFVGTQNGWAAGKDGAIIHTADGGKNMGASKKQYR